ncbi:lipoprotein LipO [Paenibacillus antibioticophila]|uniref:Lipoprotein LipO n=1 Tax=Paenibacillus antibioticophila TaxID=1274374 RepID=A0A919XTS3_9BACL|nr:extracellular solute-binding protein [Paenibacillus antibioticophila]GIO37844.1 lipoprotein LipO [Paenibacillus antibioticophila]
MNMKSWKPVMVFLLITVLLATTACSSGGGNSGNASSGGDGAPSVSSEGDKLEKKSIKVVYNGGGRKFPDGMDENNNPYLDYIKENTNLDIAMQYPPADGYQDALNVIMASGNLPDLIYTYDASWFENYVKQGALQPLDEWIDKYGPDLKKNIPEEAWKTVTIDGKIYAIPSMNAEPGNELMYVRKDWLDRLGMQPPKTLEEYREVIRAFAQDDPDGNGKNDTYGYIMAENVARIAPIIGAFGVQRGMWTERDGQLVNSSILPEMKEALAFLAGLQKDKLLDPEWMLNKEANFSEKIASGKAGLFSAFWYDTRGPILTSTTNDPAAEWIPLEFPAGPEGKQGTMGYGYIAGYNVVPVTSKNPDAVVRMLNFINGEGYRTLLLGFENEVWTMEDGKMVTNFEKHNEHIYRQTLGESVRPYNAPEERDRRDSLGLEFNLNDNIDRIGEVAIRDAFLGVPTPAMGKYTADLKKMENEYFTKIVVGQLPIDAFDEFVSEWKKRGGDEITAEVNAWYAENK